METEEKMMTGEESLSIISDMINRTKVNIRQGSFRPLIIGGITFWIFALIAHFGGHDIAPLAVPVAMLTGYLIPGYLLKRKVDHDTF